MKHQNSFAPVRETGIRCPDQLALITYGDTATLRCGLVSAYDAKFASAVDRLDKLTPGWTNTAAGLRAGIDLLRGAPRGLRLRLWLLSDGKANIDVGQIMPQVARARKSWVNINAIGFGDPQEYDAAALKAIAAGTHNGKFMTAHTAEKLGELIQGAAGRRGRMSKGEATVFVIDASGSMFFQKMDGRQRMKVVKSAMFSLIKYKQQMWS